MRQTAVLLGLFTAGALLSGTAAFGADAQLMNLVMPDAKILAGENATAAKISPFGQFIISKIGLTVVEPPKFIAATGFNPLQDVSEILAATKADPSSPGGLLLARGNFPVDRILASLAGRANPQVQTYGGAPLISVTNPKQNITHAVAFLGNSIAVAGDLASVKAAIDRSTGANSIDPALASKVNQLSLSQDEWLVSSTPLASLIPAHAPAGGATGPAMQVLALLKNVQSFNAGVKFGDNVAFSGEALTSDAQNAAALQAVMKLGLTLAASQTTANDPHLAEALQLLQGLQISTNGPAVDLSLSIPEAQIETLVNSAPVRAKAIASTPNYINGN
jgi:hypothetical protein